MATFRKVKNGWRAEVCVNRVRKSKQHPTRAAATDWARETERELLRAENVGSDILFRDLLLEYERRVTIHKLSAHWERRKLGNFADTFLAEMKAAEITPADVSRFKDQRLETVQGSTVNREFNLLSNVFSMAKEWGHVAGNPVSQVKRPKENPPRDRRISDDEIERILFVAGFEEGAPFKSVSQRVAAAFLFAIETAMRCGEICSLSPDLVQDRVATLPKTKNGERRRVALSVRAVELWEMVGQDFRLEPRQVDVTFRRIKAKAAIEDLHFHDTRHEAISRLSRTLEVLPLARMTGHKDLKKLLIYYNETAEDVVGLLDAG